MAVGSQATTAPLPTPRAALDLRAETTAAPELCGFGDHTSSIVCASGETCKFNTDIYAVACCSNDKCNWGTTCCDSRHTKKNGDPDCGGPVGDLVGYCTEDGYPFCATERWENGFTRNFCMDGTSALVKSVYLVSAGESSTRAGLLRLTGSKGPGTASTPEGSTVTMRVTETATATATGAAGGGGSPSAGVIAGSVIGGAALGVLLTVLAGVLIWRKKMAGLKVADNSQAGFEAVGQGTHNYRESAQSPYQSPYQPGVQWDAGGGRHELQAFKGRGHEIQELS